MDEHSADGTLGAIRPDPFTPDGRDLLLSRVIDAEASAEDWRAFRALAEADGSVWRDLAEAQRQHELLCEGLRAAAGRADGVDLPVLAGDAAPLQRRVDAVARWGGWAAAAALVLVWATGASVPGTHGRGLHTAGLAPAGPALSEATPAEALDRYLDAGRHSGLVVGEIPDRPVIETYTRGDGSIEVVYVRQIVERRVTDRVYREVRDDAGRAVPVAIPAAEVRSVRMY